MQDIINNPGHYLRETIFAKEAPCTRIILGLIYLEIDLQSVVSLYWENRPSVFHRW